MEYSFVFFRDRIVLNNDLKSRIKLESTPPGSKILLAAREFVVDGPFTLDGRDLVLLADSFDGSQGSIQLKAIDTGASGPKVTIACRQIAGIDISSMGGVGEQGETGAPGAEGKPGKPAPLPNKPGRPGGAGGRGGRGGRGKIGGSGGDITIVFIEDQVPGGLDAANVQVPGGPGGPRRRRWTWRPRRRGRAGQSRRRQRPGRPPRVLRASRDQPACPAAYKNRR